MMKTIEFGYDHPFTELIRTLEEEASNFCNKCRCRDKCFGKVTYHVEEIEKCKKLSKIHKLYWQAKSRSISAIAPLIIYQEEE